MCTKPTRSHVTLTVQNGGEELRMYHNFGPLCTGPTGSHCTLQPLQLEGGVMSGSSAQRDSRRCNWTCSLVFPQSNVFFQHGHFEEEVILLSPGFGLKSLLSLELAPLVTPLPKIYCRQNPLLGNAGLISLFPAPAV